ncbi:DNA primase/helicase [Microbacterium phage Huwbert]|nr:DNA primase/helicase [Microbacterium phage Huwbert]
MVSKAEVEKSLRLISKAWGPQRGYVFFPYIDREEQENSGKRRAGFHEGPSFLWPKEKDEIVDYLLSHTQHDVYWSTSIFEYPIRQEGYAMEEYALWADLDESNPYQIDDFPPTIAWESSPDRYQALWVARRGAGNFAMASWPGKENQKMTYHVGADLGGWDTAQLLRIPGWENHKSHYRDDKGNYPKGKILWFNGPDYELEDFAELPDLQIGETQLTSALSSDIDAVDRLGVIARVKLKLNHTARELLSARDDGGADKSEKLWYLIRCLADVGCSVAEIVAVVKPSVWNKFADRQDEMRRLIAEASKAIAKRSDETIEKLENEEAAAEDDNIDRPDPERLGFLLKNVKKPKYIIKDILTKGACGFIAGEPKSYKSWVGLDMAFSVATGADFLGHFPVIDPGPVLYIQEEDPPATLKNRAAKIWVNKTTDKLQLVRDDEGAGIWWLPPEEEEKFDPDVMAYIQRGFTISNEAWQEWLDETLAKGMDEVPFKLLIIDTLMMTAGDVEESKSQEMTNKIFRPLKVLSRKHDVAIIVIHHMAKAEKARPGQRMLGAVANHAWAEDSFYISHTGGKHMKIDTESKTIPGAAYRMDNLQNLEWSPTVEPWSGEDKEDKVDRHGTDDHRANRRATPQAKKARDEVISLLEHGPMTTQAIAEARNITRSSAHRQMARHLERGVVDREQLPDNSNRWFLVTVD